MIAKSSVFVAALALVSSSVWAADPSFPRPKNPERWITLDDYPGEAVRLRLEGKVRLAISVDEQGRPTACDVSSSSGSALLDSHSCNLILNRAEFYPALDSDGVPVEGKSEFGFTWLMPGGERQRDLVDIRLTFGRDGTVSKCEWVRRPVPELDPWRFCSELAGAAMLDPSGKPPRGAIYLKVDQSRIDALLSEADNAGN